MKYCSFLDLAEKDVVNVCTGQKLGRICDIEINTADCTVISIIIPEQGGVLSLGKATEIVVPWCKIECIGEDAVLIRLSAEEQTCCTAPKRKHKRSYFGK